MNDHPRRAAAGRLTGPGAQWCARVKAPPGRRRRASSWDRRAGYDDRLHVQPGASATLLDAPGARIMLPRGPNWSGQTSLYRLHLEDPIVFERSIRVTIEHGHDNRRSDDYSSTAYWFQDKPHATFPPLPPMVERLLIAAAEETP
jgi:hypothetical protein